jgi:hypothetical protein
MEKEGEYFQIHVIDQCGIHGSFLANINDCYKRVKGQGGKLLLPANCMQHVFQYHHSENTLIAYMTNSPGELTGKFANHVSKY